MTRILTNEDMKQLLTMEELIPVLEEAFVEFHAGRGGNRLRSDIVTPTRRRQDGLYALKSMDGVIPKFDVGAVRINSDILTWPEGRGGMRRVKDRYVGLVLVFDTVSGEPLIICQDGFMSHLRVGATSALAAKYMARKDTDTATIIGSGYQAESQLLGLNSVFDLRDIRVYSPSPESRESYAERMSERIGKTVRACGTGEEAVAGSHVVHCATNAVKPVFFREWLEPGMHVGIIRPAATEVEPSAWPDFDLIALLDHDDEPEIIYTHGVQVGEERAGSGMGMAHDDFHASLPPLPSIIAGDHPGRQSEGDRTLFMNNLGMGYQFAAAGYLASRKLQETQIGFNLPDRLFIERE